MPWFLTFFSFSTFSLFLQSLRTSITGYKKSLYLVLLYPVPNVSFFQTKLSFLSVLGLWGVLLICVQKWGFLCLSAYSFWFLSTYSYNAEHLGKCFPSNLENNQHYSCRFFFCHLLSLFFILKSSYTYTGYLIFPFRCLMFCYFSSTLFLSVPQIICSYCSIGQVH